MKSLFSLLRHGTWCTSALVLAACTRPAPAEEPAPPKNLAPPTLHELLPLKDNTVSNFERQTDLGEKGIFVLEIFRPRPEVAELVIAGSVRRVSVEDKRITHLTGGVLLEEPLEVGHSFAGSFGETKITAVNAAVDVPAGSFTGCVTTVEESTQPPKRSTSTYCRDVGLVKMVIESFGADGGQVEARLVHHGPRVDVFKAPPTDEQPN